MISTLLLLCGVAACLATAYALRGGLTSPGGTTVMGMDLQGIGFAVLSIVAAIWFFGPLLGLALIAVVVIHEFGHVAAFRAAGHADARFRLVPLLGGYAISNRQPDTQEESVFITLMGPAICMAPMLLAYGLVPLAAATFPAAIMPLVTFAGVCGALNFFNLLPIWPLDGGRLTASIAGAFWEPLPLLIGSVVSGLLMLFAVYNSSLLLGFLAIMGLQNLVTNGGSDGRTASRTMSKPRALLCLGAWFFTTITLFFGGFGMIMRFV